jgi:hypothetical protein
VARERSTRDGSHARSAWGAAQKANAKLTAGYGGLRRKKRE